MRFRTRKSKYLKIEKKQYEKRIMGLDKRIRNRKVLYGLHREGAKMSALSSGAKNEYEYLTGAKILSPEKSGTIAEYMT